MSISTTYDPAFVAASFCGVPISGYADGTFISVERNEDSYSLVVGAGGEATRVRSRNSSGKVTFTLLASSPCNDLLSAIAAADELAGTGVGPVLVKDVNGTTLCMANNAWISKPPRVEFGKELGTREWVIECESLSVFAGGTLPVTV